MVSIVITYIDEVDYLKDSLKSAQSQALTEVEIIVVCNDPVANHQNFSLAADTPEVVWIHEPIRGSAAARNAGLHHAKGEWIQFLDVDDLLLADKISNQLKQNATGAIVSPHTFKRLNGLTKKSRWIADDIWFGLLNSGLGSTSSMLWKREAVLKSGGWSSQYQSHQEYDLLFRLLKNGYTIATSDKRDTIVRERKKGSITLMTKPIRAKEGIRLREEMWTYLSEKDMNTPERKDAFLQYVFRQLRGIYLTDPVAAKTIYNKYFSDGTFVPEKGSISFYNFMYKSMGFQKTEGVIHLYRAIRDRYLPFLPKNK
jgi:glycosyltransferase involved in cell wall biosynthesis